MKEKTVYSVIKIFLLFAVIFPQNNSAQTETDSVEVFLIDSYVTPEKPHRFMLSFFTSTPVKSRVMIDDKDEYIVSSVFTENHKAEIDLTDLVFIKTSVPFFIISEDSAGNTFFSERYEFDLPYETEIKGGSDLFTFCLFGGIVFALPSPAYVKMKDEDYFSLTKEIPIIFIRSSGLGYPTGYFAAEYSHIFNAPVKNLFRAGYKHLIGIPGIEYVSPGINGVTNFKGFNGISPEISLGLFRIYNAFTVYTRYRFSVKPGDAGSEFHEISIGLYSGFFALYF